MDEEIVHNLESVEDGNDSTNISELSAKDDNVESDKEDEKEDVVVLDEVPAGGECKIQTSKVGSFEDDIISVESIPSTINTEDGKEGSEDDLICIETTDSVRSDTEKDDAGSNVNEDIAEETDVSEISKNSDNRLAERSQKAGVAEASEDENGKSDTVGGDDTKLADANSDAEEEEEESLIIDESSIDRESNTEIICDEKEDPKGSSTATSQVIEDPIKSQPSSSSNKNLFSKDAEATPEVKSPAKRRHRTSDVTISPQLLEAFKVPFKHGWKREVVNRNVVTSGKRSQCDIYYFCPTGKKLRSMVEIETWLNENKSCPLKRSNFSFARMSIFEPPFEIVRDAGKSRRHPNVSLNEGVPKKPQTPAKRIEKPKNFTNPLYLKSKQLISKATGFKSVLSSQLEQPNKSMNVVPIAKDVPSSNVVIIRPKIKYVPKVKNPQILSKLLDKSGSRPAKMRGHTFLKRPRPVSPDWIPSGSDSDVEVRCSPARNVEVIKYGVSDQATGSVNKEGDDLHNVLGTPSKLISSIVNPAPPQTSDPIPFNVDATPAGTVKFQILTKKNAKPEEVIAQLGLNAMKYRILKPAPLPSQNISSTDTRFVLLPHEKQQSTPLNSTSRMPFLHQRPPTITRPTPVPQQIILPPPPPLASRPGLTRPVVVSSIVGNFHPPPLHNPSLVSNPVPFIVAPPPLQTSVVRQQSPSLAPHTSKTVPSLQSAISKNNPSSSIPNFLTLAPGGSDPTVSSTKATRSSTPELVDKIFNDLPNFLGIDPKTNVRSNYSSVSLLSCPSLVNPMYRTPNFNQTYVTDQENLTKGGKNSNEESSGKHKDQPESGPALCKVNQKEDHGDPDDEDSTLPVSFGQAHSKRRKDRDHLPNAINECQSMTDNNLEDSSAIFESDDSSSNSSDPVQVVDKPVTDSAHDAAISPLTRREFLTFKLLQDNIPAMLKIFEQLSMFELLRVSRVCKSWHRISLMKCLWENIVVNSVFENNWHRAVKFFINVGVTDLTIKELPNNGRSEAMDAMITALGKMTQLKRLQFNIVPQHLVTRILESMPHLEHVGAEFIVDSEPPANSEFNWSTVSKEFAMGKAVDAILIYGKTVTEAATICSVNEAELKHLMLSEPTALQKHEEDALLLGCMRLAQMGFTINHAVIEACLEDEIAKRPQPCRPPPHFQKLFCHRLLQRNSSLFKNKLPYQPWDPQSKKLSSYYQSLHKIYQDIDLKRRNSVLVFTMEKYSVLNPAGNRICNVTALSAISAANLSLPVMLIFPNVVRYPETVCNLLLVGSKEGTPTPNLVAHYLRKIISDISVRPLIVFFDGHENMISRQLISECINSSVFFHCVPQDISNYVFPGNYGGVLHSVSKNLKYSLVREKDFIDLMCKEIKTGNSENMSQIFAKTGIYPVKPNASVKLYQTMNSDIDSGENITKEGNIWTENVGEIEDDKSSNVSRENENVLNLENEQNNNGAISTLKNKSNSNIPVSVVDSAVPHSLSYASPNTYLNGDDKVVGFNLSRPSNRVRRVARRGRKADFWASFTGRGKSTTTEEPMSSAEQTGNGNLNKQRLSEKRSFDSMQDAESKTVEEIPCKRLKANVSSVALIEQTIDEVIAKSREEAEAKERYNLEDSNNGSESNDSDDSKEIPVRPSIKIRRSSHGLVSVLNNSENSKDGEVKESQQIKEEEEVSESEKEEDESSDKEMKIDEVENENDVEDETKIEKSKLETSHEEGMETNEVSSDISDVDVDGNDKEIKDETGDTSHLLEDDSELESPVKPGKKVKKKKKRSHRSLKGEKEKGVDEAGIEPRNDHKKKRKKKKKKKRSKRIKTSLEKTDEELAVVEISSPPHESATQRNVVEDAEDENEKKLMYIRRVSLADHDYEMKFDSDSGTEAVNDDQETKLAPEGDKGNVEANSTNSETRTEGDEMKHSTPVKVDEPEEEGDDKGETSDSDSSSSNSGSSGSSDSEAASGGSGSSSDSSSGPNGSSNGNSSDSSEKEEVEKEKVVSMKDVSDDDNNSDEEEGKLVVKEKSDSDDGVDSSSSDKASSSNSDSEKEEEEGEQSNDEEEEGDDDEEEEEAEDDSKCQLCMLANPPHSKDTIIDWVDCDGNCGRWFHVICINRSQAKANPKHYLCPSCRCRR